MRAVFVSMLVLAWAVPASAQLPARQVEVGLGLVVGDVIRDAPPDADGWYRQHMIGAGAIDVRVLVDRLWAVAAHAEVGGGAQRLLSFCFAACDLAPSETRVALDLGVGLRPVLSTTAHESLAVDLTLGISGAARFDAWGPDDQLLGGFAAAAIVAQADSVVWTFGLRVRALAAGVQHAPTSDVSILAAIGVAYAAPF